MRPTVRWAAEAGPDGGWRVEVDWSGGRESGPWDSCAGARPAVWLLGNVANRGELRETLGVSEPEDAADPHLVRSAYERWGYDAASRLAGALACAVWDSDLDTLIAFTDPFAARPLFYCVDAERMAVATDTRRLRQLAWVSNDVEDTSVVAYLVGAALARDATFYRAIRRLPGGHMLVARRGNVHISRYWGPFFRSHPDLRTQEHLLDAFRDQFTRVVHQALDPSEAAAILMSGGFDSTAVAFTAARAGQSSRPALPNVRLYSSVFPGLSCDESDRIRVAQRALPFPARTFCPMDQGLDIDEIRHDVARHDAPYANAQGPMFAQYFGACSADGIQLLLSGLGGDEMAIDWEYLVDMVRRVGLTDWPRAVWRVARLEQLPLRAAAAMLLRGRLPRWAGASPLRRTARRLLGRHAPHPPLRCEWWPLADSLLRPRPEDPVGYDSHTGEIRWQWINASRCQHGHAWWHREVSARRLRLVSPFTDQRIVELVLGAPSHLHPRSFDSAVYKPLISLALGAWMPAELTGRYWKVQFADYERHVLTHSITRLHEYLFHSSQWKASRFVTVDDARILLDEFRQALTSVRSSAKIGATVLRVVGLETWLRGHASEQR